MLLAEAQAPVRPATLWRPDIQGIRAAAVLMVVLFHAGVGVGGGFAGVDVFFVVSGFVISTLLLRELAATGRVRMGRFYLRRVRRLLPALGVISIVGLLLASVALSPLGGGQQAMGYATVSAAAFVANAFFLVTTGGYFQQSAESNPLLHTWTLSVEEQFYLVFPFLLVLGWRLRRRLSGRWLVALLVACLVVSLCACLSFTFDWVARVPGLTGLARPDLAPQIAFYSPLCRGWEFLAGALLALADCRWSPRRGLAAAFGVAGAALLVVTLIGLDSADAFPGILATLPVGSAACLILAGCGAHRPVATRVLSCRPAVALGDLSYSWYLWHWPAIVFVRAQWPDRPWLAATAAFAALIPAILSYRLVEQPIRQRYRLSGRRATAFLAVGCVAVPAIGGVALARAADRSWGRRDIAALQAEVRPEHADLVEGCTATSPLGSPDRPSCTWTVPSPRGTVLLIGDSNAGHLTEPLVAATRALGYDLQVATDGGCPMLRRARYFTAACGQFVEGSLAAIRSRIPAYSAVVLSNADAGYLDGPLASDLAGDVPPGTETARQRAISGWSADLAGTVTAVAGRSPVLVIGAVPQFPNLPQCVLPSVLSSAVGGCGRLDAAQAARLRGDVIAGERAAAEHSGASFFDTGQRLCRASGCSAFLDGKLVYRDGAHLSVAGSMIFQDDLRAALAPVLARPAGADG